MRKQPGHIDRRELARTLTGQWGLGPGRPRDLWLAAGDDACAAGRYAELTGPRTSRTRTPR